RDAGRGATRRVWQTVAPRVLPAVDRAGARRARGVRRVRELPDARPVPGRGSLGTPRTAGRRVPEVRRDLRDDVRVPQDAVLADRPDGEGPRTVRAEGAAGLSGHGRDRFLRREPR